MPMQTRNLPYPCNLQPPWSLQQLRSLLHQGRLHHPCSLQQQPCGLRLRQPFGLSHQPCGLVQQPCGLVQQPRGLVQQPCSLVQQPRGLVQQPCSVVQQPRGLVQQPRGLVQQSCSLQHLCSMWHPCSLQHQWLTFRRLSASLSAWTCSRRLKRTTSMLLSRNLSNKRCCLICGVHSSLRHPLRQRPLTTSRRLCPPRLAIVTGMVADMLKSMRAQIQATVERDLASNLQSATFAVIIAVVGAILMQHSSLMGLPIIKVSALSFAAFVCLRFISARLAVRMFCLAPVGLSAAMAVLNTSRSPEELNEQVESVHLTLAAPAVAIGGALIGSFPASIVSLKLRGLTLALIIILRILCMLRNYARTGNTRFLYLPIVLNTCALASFTMTAMVVHSSATLGQRQAKVYAVQARQSGSASFSGRLTRAPQRASNATTDAC